MAYKDYCWPGSGEKQPSMRLEYTVSYGNWSQKYEKTNRQFDAETANIDKICLLSDNI